MPRVLVIEHDRANPPGLLAACFGWHGWDADRVMAPGGLAGVAWGRYDAILACGSDYSVDDPAVAGWLAAERDLLRAAHNAGVPVLGVCFGAQVLALALGGLVTRMPRPEIGWRTLTRVPGTGRMVSQGPWFCWHEDRFTPPPGARVLAHTAAGPQAFTLGASLGVQFHPEADTALVRSWLGHLTPAGAGHLGLDPGELIAETCWHEAAAATRGGLLVSAFIAGCHVIRPYATYA